MAYFRALRLPLGDPRLFNPLRNQRRHLPQGDPQGLWRVTAVNPDGSIPQGEAKRSRGGVCERQEEAEGREVEKAD
jgi:hypothetical protein